MVHQRVIRCDPSRMTLAYVGSLRNVWPTELKGFEDLG